MSRPYRVQRGTLPVAVGDEDFGRGIRVVLRDWTLDDLPALERWLQPDQKWNELDGPYYLRPDPEEIPGVVERYRTAIESGRISAPRRELAVARAGDESRLLGRVSRYWQSKETHWLSLGVVLFDPETWGCGLAYEALGLWCQYVLDALPVLARLDLRTWSGNERMMRLAQRLGFREEARFRRARIVNGKYYDSIGYGILREEWAQRYPREFQGSPR